MRTVKIKYIGFYPSFKPENEQIYRVLKNHYDVQITDDADYVICGIFGKPYEYCGYDQIRIMNVGENYTPDFNFVDYAISRYPIKFQDRHFQYEGCYEPLDHWQSFSDKERTYTADVLAQKEYFANFIASHESENNIRGDFFKKLSEYKRVESIGSYLNNMKNGETVQWTNSSKTEFQRKCKFTLCFESTKHEGFITEKITDAFFADTIPVYYGSTSVTNIFNPDAFINCSQFESVDEAIQKIIELDNDDEAYLAMLRQPVLNAGVDPVRVFEGLEKWVLHIFEQPLEKAYRRSLVYYPKEYNDMLRASVCIHKVILKWQKNMKRIRGKLKKIRNILMRS